jgi:hypothetical protein
MTAQTNETAVYTVYRDRDVSGAVNLWGGGAASTVKIYVYPVDNLDEPDVKNHCDGEDLPQFTRKTDRSHGFVFRIRKFQG